MKKVFFFMAMALLSVFAVAQTNQVVWQNGKVMYSNPIPAIDSITYADEAVEQDTLHLLLPRTAIRTVYQTVIKEVEKIVVVKDTIIIDKCGSKGIGEFSVSADKKVSFSKGNLQYNAKENTWRFAENQYDYIGADNINVSSTYDGWIDMFGWGTGDAPTKTERDNAEYSTFVDWGSNIIGTDDVDLWRTLSKDEWDYLFNTRSNAANLWAFSTVNGVTGIILLPDNFSTSSISWTARGDNWATNTYTAEQWKAMEEQGAVLLPAAGNRNTTTIGIRQLNVGTICSYWSSTKSETVSTYACGLFFGTISSKLYTATNNEGNRYGGSSVRLVQDL